MRTTSLGLFILAATPACATAPAVATSQSRVASSGVVDMLDALHGPDGPARFGMVNAKLYRGGQPTDTHLWQLRALGVTKIVDLRRERLGVRRAEHAAARELGIEMVELPFFGVFGAEPGFLERVVAELSDANGGAVYVHCDDGRDRTSLAVALYRVEVEGWSPARAWRREALDYGHEPRALNREIELAFREHVLEHAVRTHTETVAPVQMREVAAIRADQLPAAGVRAAADAPAGGALAARDD